MLTDPASRREFLRAAGATGAAWLLADLVVLEDAFAHATRRRNADPPHRFEALTAEQAADLEAVCSRILPSDGSPGAKEAGVIHFIDRSLATFNASQKPLFDEGIANLNRRAAQRWPGTAAFAALTPERQDQLLRAIENEPFFQAARFATLVGMFADPSWGGNRDYVGFTLLGIDHQPIYQPPFGWYDAEANRAR
jgi:gluconate 2-dehydrogenase gamma chain